MSMGRVPVQACDYCVMPFADRIDYSKCSVSIPEADVAKTDQIILDFLSDHKDDDLREMGAYGREMWERWLDPNKWEDLFGEVIKEKL
jgi:hypothetical protein